MENDFEDDLFADDVEEYVEPVKDFWKIMIVDDEEEVHSVTKMVLSKVTYSFKSLLFLSAYTGDEALRLIKENPDTAIVLLDVVMENDDSGLYVIKEIREVLKNKHVRIILRTGQPGQAPEKDIIMHYDINDYKAKNELTSQKLFTSVISSLRSFQDIMRIDQNRKGLKQIIESSSSLFELQSMEKFVAGVLTQLVSVLDLKGDSLYCQTSGFFSCNLGSDDFIVLSGTGKYKDNIKKNVKEIVSSEIMEFIKEAYNMKENIFTNKYAVVFFKTKNNSSGFVYVECHCALDEWDKNLVKVFCQNVSVAFDNICLYDQVKTVQEAAIKGLSNLAEFKDRDTGDHLQRVRNLSMLTAKWLYDQGKFASDIDAEFIEQISIASILHDVGKVGIPEKILLKPGKLTKEEYEEIKTHTTIGGKILETASKAIDGESYLKIAAEIAMGHHENFNGTGYPDGLLNNKTSVAARIVAVVDVYDALTSKRPYKEPWPKEKAIETIKNDAGSRFDPEIVYAFLEVIKNEQ